jgi:hypothetical protein
MDEVNSQRRILYEVIYDFYSSTNVIWVTKSRRMGKVGHSAQITDRRCGNLFWWKNLGDGDHWKTYIHMGG